MNLHAKSALVIHLREGVQFLAECLVFLHVCLVCYLGEGRKIEVYGMKGIDADGIVGIAIAPSRALCGVIDGEKLDDAHTSGIGPINQLFQVAKVAHTLTGFATQRKDGDDDTSRLPMLIYHA